MTDRKVTAEQRMALFDPASIEAGLRDLLVESRILDHAAAIIPFSLLSTSRLKGIVRALSLVGDLAGETAEIGCNAGGTSRLIALLNRRRRHWACDTFIGLVDVGVEDTSKAIVNGAFSNRLAKFDDVTARLSDLNVRVVRGYFPDDAPSEMITTRYAFAHIDVDTYRSIHSSFVFFSRRMVKGGIIALDDVIGRGTDGAKLAWQEIIAARGKDFDVIETNDPQVIIRFK